jgi:hypothetical protein
MKQFVWRGIDLIAATRIGQRRCRDFTTVERSSLEKLKRDD